MIYAVLCEFDGESNLAEFDNEPAAREHFALAISAGALNISLTEYTEGNDRVLAIHRGY